MVAFYIWDDPHIARILAQGIAGVTSGFWAFEVLLARILLRYPYRIEIKDILLGFGEPHDGLVSARKPSAAV
jgi:hypothetical protein